GPDAIVRPENEGDSDRRCSSVLDQHNSAVEVAQRVGGPAPVYRDNPPDSGGAPTATDAAPESAQPPVVEAPLTPSRSSVYVIPYRPTTYGVYGYYPYPYSYSPYSYIPYYYSPYYYGAP